MNESGAMKKNKGTITVMGMLSAAIAVVGLPMSGYFLARMGLASDIQNNKNEIERVETAHINDNEAVIGRLDKLLESFNIVYIPKEK